MTSRGPRAWPPSGRRSSENGNPPSQRLVSAVTVARVYADLERRGVLETRRGVGSFVSATPAQAQPPRDRDRRLRAFVTRLLADADAAGFTLEEVREALAAHSKGVRDGRPT